jgi:PAP2 superfamily.
MDLIHSFHSLELIVISLIQEFRTPVFDEFFKYLDFFDRLEFFFILIPALWLGKEWKWGLRIFYIFFLSGLANHFLKEFFLSPRPFHLDPSLAVIQVNRYGFPSGAAQTVILLSGILLNHWDNSWK